MATLTITANDRSRLVIGGAKYKQETFTAAGAATFAAGTILARKQVSDTVTADGTGNTGDGTCTALSVDDGPIIPEVGDYNLECVEAITNGGRFKLVTPSGRLLTNQLTMTAGAGTATAFAVGGLKFTLTDNTTDFIVGDAFAITVSAGGKLVVFATDGAGGAQYPCAILPYAHTTTGAGDTAINALIGGTIRTDKLVINADGDATNVTNMILDQLRGYGFVPVAASDLSDRDNYS